MQFHLQALGTQKSVTIAGDTIGTWHNNGINWHFYFFGLGTGSTFSWNCWGMGGQTMLEPQAQHQ
jgi:hypothetical protein